MAWDRYGNPIVQSPDVLRLRGAIDQLVHQREVLLQQADQLQRALQSTRRQLATRTEENSHLLNALRDRQHHSAEDWRLNELATERDMALREAREATERAHSAEQRLARADNALEEARADHDRALAAAHSLQADLEEARAVTPQTGRIQELAADLANVRRQRDQQIAAGVRHEKARLLGEVASLGDGLRRALAAGPKDGSAWQVGLEALARQAEDILVREGATLIGVVGEAFDPSEHEAIAVVPVQQPSGLVIEVVERGLRLDEQLVRPARVVVSQ